MRRRLKNFLPIVLIALLVQFSHRSAPCWAARRFDPLPGRPMAMPRTVPGGHHAHDMLGLQRTADWRGRCNMPEIARQSMSIGLPSRWPGRCLPADERPRRQPRAGAHLRHFLTTWNTPMIGAATTVPVGAVVEKPAKSWRQEYPMYRSHAFDRTTCSSSAALSLVPSNAQAQALPAMTVEAPRGATARPAARKPAPR